MTNEVLGEIPEWVLEKARHAFEARLNGLPGHVEDVPEWVSV